jgi:hypothetical protein
MKKEVVMGTKTFQELSRLTYSKGDSQIPSIDEVNLGCFQRIANSMEIMCKDRVKLERENDYMSKRIRDLNSENDTLRRRVATYKGKFNSLKNKIGGGDGR